MTPIHSAVLAPGAGELTAILAHIARTQALPVESVTDALATAVIGCRNVLLLARGLPTPTEAGCIVVREVNGALDASGKAGMTLWQLADALIACRTALGRVLDYHAATPEPLHIKRRVRQVLEETHPSAIFAGMTPPEAA